MPTPNRLRILAPDTATHADQVATLIAETFHEQPSPETLARIRGFGDLPNWVQMPDCRIGLLDGRVVTNVTVFRYLTRIGSARLATAGIGAVATDGNYRKRGLMRDTFGATVDAMQEAGYDISVLFGIPDFYCQFGYVRGWSDDSVTVKAKDLKPTRSAPATEDFSGTALAEDVLACMNRWQETLDGTAVRPTHGGRNKHQGDHILARCWRDDGTAVAGTLITKLEEGRLRIEDACGDPEDVIALVERLCTEHDQAEVTFSLLPYRSALSRRLRLGECRVSRGYRRNAGALVRTVNLSSCLGKLAADFAARLAASRHHGWHGSLLVGDGRQEANLEIQAGSVQITPATDTAHRLQAGDYAATLIFGAEDPADTLARPEVSTQGDAAVLATILFPELDPQLPSLDRY